MKCVLVTGASSGIGRASVQALLKEGYFVWAALRKPEMIDDLKSSFPDRLEALKVDVTSEEDLQKALERISGADERISEFSLINNAGIATGGPLEALPLKEWRNLFEVNVFGLVRTTQVFLPLLRKHRGRVINIGSVSGRISSPYLSTYSASKFAVRALTDALRREMLPFGVRVVLLEPGPIKTEIWEKSLSRGDELKSAMSHEHLKTYADDLERLVGGVQSIAAMAVPVERVTSRILKVLQNPRPAPFYLIGKGIHLQMLLVRLLPTRWLDLMLMKGLGYSKMKR